MLLPCNLLIGAFSYMCHASLLSMLHRVHLSSPHHACPPHSTYHILHSCILHRHISLTTWANKSSSQECQSVFITRSPARHRHLVRWTYQVCIKPTQAYVSCYLHMIYLHPHHPLSCTPKLTLFNSGNAFFKRPPSTTHFNLPAGFLPPSPKHSC